jgi:hypothetical protein
MSDKILTDDPGDDNDDTVNDPPDAEKVEEGDLEPVAPHDDDDDE